MELELDLQEATLQTADLEKELLVLRLAFGKLKVAVAEAMAPITAGITKAMSGAVFWATSTVKKIGQVIAALTGYRGAQDAVTKSVKTTTGAVKRYLAGFDEINRIGQSSGRTAVALEVTPGESLKISPEMEAVAAKIKSFFQPLLAIDLTPLRWNIARLEESFLKLVETVKPGLSGLWENMLVPFLGWVTERLVPMLLITLRGAVEMLSAALPPLGEGFSKVFQAMQPVFSFIGQSLIVALDQLKRMFVSVAELLSEKGQTIRQIFENVAELITVTWQALYPLLEELRMQWSLTTREMGKNAVSLVGLLLDNLQGMAKILLGVFTGDWKKVWEGMKLSAKSSINGIIGVLNGMLSGLTGGVNAMVRAVNKLKFTLPDWIPGLGGKSFGLSLPTVKTPQIPYLAQGAVLPAGKPFLAVVGDQRHGTNVEAPLATIQEAMALVMEDFVASNTAGQEAVVAVLTRILQAVLGISLNESTVAGAVSRYQDKMAVVKGV